MSRSSDRRRAIEQSATTEPEGAESLRRTLRTLRDCLPEIEDTEAAQGGGGGRSVPASRPPLSLDRLSLAQEVRRDLAFWVRAMIDGRDEAGLETDAQGLDLGDPYGCIRLLTEYVSWLAAWSYAWRMWSELDVLAREARAMTAREPRLTLGPCPNTVGAERCGTTVWSNGVHPESIRCSGCGLTDTIDGWILRMTGHERPVTIPQLVPILHRRLGEVITERTLRRWHRQGRMPSPVGGSESTPTFDRRAVLAMVVLAREA